MSLLRYDSIVRDPVHGDIPLTQEEIKLLDTPEMQRLRDVRQLGATYLVYPGAQHSRFEHSIGTAHLATRMAESINLARDKRMDGRLDGIDAHGLRILRLAALVHDVTHLPFGHNIEDQTGLLPRHDTPGRFERMFGDGTELGRVLGRTGAREDVLALLSPESVPEQAQVPQHWRALVSGTIDADMLDYLARDAMFTGLRLEYDPRVFNIFRVDRASQRLFVDLGSRGYLKEAVVSEIVRCLEARFYFSERVYYHHAKIAAGSLIAKAVEIALLAKAVSFEQLQTSTDSGLVALLEGAEISDPRRRALLETYLQAWRRRQLPKRVGVFPVYANQGIQSELIERYFGAGSAELRRQVEAEMSAALEKRLGRAVPIMLYCPAGEMQLKQAEILVRWPGEQGLTPLSNHVEQIPRLADLEQSYTRMWKFYVHALTSDPAELQAASDVCAEFFPNACNVLERVRI